MARAPVVYDLVNVVAQTVSTSMLEYVIMSGRCGSSLTRIHTRIRRTQPVPTPPYSDPYGLRGRCASTTGYRQCSVSMPRGPANAEKCIPSNKIDRVI